MPARRPGRPGRRASHCWGDLHARRHAAGRDRCPGAAGLLLAEVLYGLGRLPLGVVAQAPDPDGAQRAAEDDLPLVRGDLVVGHGRLHRDAAGGQGRDDQLAVPAQRRPGASASVGVGEVLGQPRGEDGDRGDGDLLRDVAGDQLGPWHGVRVPVEAGHELQQDRDRRRYQDERVGHAAFGHDGPSVVAGSIARTKASLASINRWRPVRSWSTSPPAGKRLAISCARSWHIWLVGRGYGGSCLYSNQRSRAATAGCRSMMLCASRARWHTAGSHVEWSRSSGSGTRAQPPTMLVWTVGAGPVAVIVVLGCTA